MNVIAYGLGPIGVGIARVLLKRGYVVAGGIDIDPAKAGRDLGELLGVDPLGVAVEADADAVLRRGGDIVVHSTQSRLSQVLPQLEAALDAGLDVASTCEELAFPWYHHPAEARRLDALGRARGVTLVGLGVNPGFVMDALPLLLTTPQVDVQRVVAQRVVDAGRRRIPLQRKIGAGLAPDAFRAGVSEGRIAHVGLVESVAMIADALGWRLADVAEEIEPVLGSDGLVRGLHQVARGYRDGGAAGRGGEPAIVLDLVMAVGAEGPRDTVNLEGDPPLRIEIPGGVHGDVATWATVANALPLIKAAPPGLLPVTRLPLLHFSLPA